MINQIVMDGYIGKDLELKTTQSLKEICNFYHLSKLLQ